MTTLQVHLMMLGLGILVFLLLAGVYGKRQIQRKSKPWISILAGIAIAASPFSRLWHNPFNGIDLLTQSLLISALCLLALLLLSLLRIPYRAIRRSRVRRQNSKAHALFEEHASTVGLTAIEINADSLSSAHAEITTENDVLANDIKTTDQKSPANGDSATPESAGSNMSMFNSSTYSDPLRSSRNANEVTLDKSRSPDTENMEKHLQPSDQIELSDIDASSDQASTATQDMPAIESVLPKKSHRDGTAQLDKTISDTSAANDRSSIEIDADFDSELHDITSADSLVTPATHSLLAEEALSTPSIPNDEDGLDLSETEQLFAEIRSQHSELELPDDKELKDATQRVAIEELDFDSTLVTGEKNDQQARDNHAIEINDDLIEEAEVVDVDNTNMEFGNDLTGEYAHPNERSSSTTNFIDNTTAEDVDLPETLGEAMIAAKVSTLSVQTQISNLEDSIGEVDVIRENQASVANDSFKSQQSALEQKNALLTCEDETRKAAESVIAAQNAIIDKVKREQAVADSLLRKERHRLQLMQQEVERSKKMARSAALLARKAAVAQQEIRNVAKREQNARLKSQESTRKAVTIARNAISALAAEERKRGITRH